MPTSFPIVVIGLPRRHDRRAALETMLASTALPRPLFAADLGAVVDWRDWGEAEVEALRGRVFPWCDVSASNPWWRRHLKLGEIACTLSHWNVWTLAKAFGVDGIVVLEDDAMPGLGMEALPNVLDELTQEDPAWDLLYLGRARLQPDRGHRGRFAIPGFSYHTHAYVVSARGVGKMLDTDLPHAIIPADEFLPAMYMAHPRADVRARFPPTLAAYALVEDTVQQVPKQASGSDTEASPFLVPADQFVPVARAPPIDTV